MDQNTPDSGEFDPDPHFLATPPSCSTPLPPDFFEYDAGTPPETAEIHPETAEMPAPPAGETFESYRAAIDAANDFAREFGYAMVIDRSKRSKTGVKKTVYIGCDRGRKCYPIQDAQDNAQDSGNRPLRGVSSRRINSTFRITARRQFLTGMWELTVERGGHTHGPSAIGSTHPAHRRLALQRQIESVDFQLLQGIQPRQIWTGITFEDGRVALKLKDLYNRRQAIVEEFLAGRTAVQALLEQLPVDGDWLFRYKTRRNGSISALFGMHRTSLALLQKHPYVLFMDCTYKTNRYRMPMLDIVGIAATGQTFFAGFAFLSDEKQASYEFALQCLREVYSTFSSAGPRTIFTDKEKALLNSIAAVFPETTSSLICLWHINQNILKKARPAIRRYVQDQVNRGDLETVQFSQEIANIWAKMKQRWMRVVFADTEDAMYERWHWFTTSYGDDVFSELLAYIEREWLADGRYFLRCYTNRLFHLGEIATSRCESAHWLLKRDLRSSQMNLLHVFQSFEITVKRQHTQIYQKAEEQRIRAPARFKATPLLTRVVRRISWYAISSIQELIDRHLPPGPEKDPFSKTCIGCFKAFGYPCIHLIQQALAADRPLEMSDFHLQWHLYQHSEAPPITIDLRVREPEPATRRGRPPGAPNAPKSSGRDRTGTEIMEASERRAEQRVRAEWASQEAPASIPALRIASPAAQDLPASMPASPAAQDPPASMPASQDRRSGRIRKRPKHFDW